MYLMWLFLCLGFFIFNGVITVIIIVKWRVERQMDFLVNLVLLEILVLNLSYKSKKKPHG